MQAFLTAIARRVAYEVIVALRDNARGILGREMRKRDARDAQREPDSVDYWTRQAELFEGARALLGKQWAIN